MRIASIAVAAGALLLAAWLLTPQKSKYCPRRHPGRPISSW